MFQPRSYDIIIRGKMPRDGQEPVLLVSIGEFGSLTWHNKSDIPALVNAYRDSYPDIKVWAKYSPKDMKGYVMEIVEGDVPDAIVDLLKLMNEQRSNAGIFSSDPQPITIVGNPYGTGVYYMKLNDWISLINGSVELPLDKEQLCRELTQAVKEENYELAAKLRDKINNDQRSDIH
jgi:hypothetical protein